MAAAELTFDTSGAGIGQPVYSGKGINEYMEIPGTPEIEIFRVTSDADGDWLYSRRFSKIKAAMCQNHGADYTSSTTKDAPKIVVTQGTSTAKVTINHTATSEIFSIILIGEM